MATSAATAVSPMTSVATTTAAATVTPTTTTSAASTSAGTATTAARTISTTVAGARGLRGVHTIEVWLVAFVEVSAAFESQCTAGNRRRDSYRFDRASIFPTLTVLRRRSAAHLCALFFQDSFA